MFMKIRPTQTVARNRAGKAVTYIHLSEIASIVLWGVSGKLEYIQGIPNNSQTHVPIDQVRRRNVKNLFLTISLESKTMKGVAMTTSKGRRMKNRRMESPNSTVIFGRAGVASKKRVSERSDKWIFTVVSQSVGMSNDSAAASSEKNECLDGKSVIMPLCNQITVGSKSFIRLKS